MLLRAVLDQTRPAWEQLIERVGLRYPTRQMTLSAPRVGEDYRGELMVIGRCTNGGAGIPGPDRLDDLFSIQASGLSDVEPPWPQARGSSPNFFRSPFWWVARDVFRELAGEPGVPARWPQRLAWSSLYKVARAGPAGLGPATLSVAQKRFQLDLARRILAAELAVLKPSHVLLLTGWEHWAGDFAAVIGPDIEVLPAPDSWVEAHGRTPAGSRVVVSRHPQGKAQPHAAKQRIVEFLAGRGSAAPNAR